jgi:uncharacterized protein
LVELRDGISFHHTIYNIVDSIRQKIEGNTDMKTLVIAIFAVVLGASIVGNFLLYQQNVHLMGLIDVMTKDNEKLSNTIAEINAETEYPKQTAIPRVEKEIFELNVSLSEKEQQETEDNSKPQPSSSQSITAVGVRPLVVRDGFFERTQYEGTIMEILVSIKEQGDGFVLVNTEVPTGIAFQESAKTAIKIAQEYLDADLSDKDIVFSITVDADKTRLQTVDGYSAGAAMTVLLISELQGKSISNDMVITGSILPDASIGRVGGIFDKAEAAGKHGAKIFLVPSDQNVTQVESCEESRTGNFIYRSCTLEEKPLSPITEEMFGMEIREVSDIEDAVRYFQTGLFGG